jgi:hypothetical protein
VFEHQSGAGGGLDPEDEAWALAPHSQHGFVHVDASGRLVVAPTMPHGAVVPLLHVVALNLSSIPGLADERSPASPWLLQTERPAGLAVLSPSAQPLLDAAGVSYELARNAVVVLVTVSTTLFGTPAFAAGSGGASESAATAPAEDGSVSDATWGLLVGQNVQVFTRTGLVEGTVVSYDANAVTMTVGGESQSIDRASVRRVSIAGSAGSTATPTNSGSAPTPAPQPAPSNAPATTPTEGASAPVVGPAGASAVGVPDSTLKSLVGQRVAVTTASGVREGTLNAYDGTTLTLIGKKGVIHVVDRADIAELRAGASGAGRKMIIAGGILTGIGGAAVIAGFGIGAYKSFYAPYTVPPLAGVALVTGISLLVVGKKKQRGVAGAPTGPSVAIAPIVTPRRWGGGLTLRF